VFVTTKVCEALPPVVTPPKSSIDPLAGSSARAAGARPAALRVADAVPPGVAPTAKVAALPLALDPGVNVTETVHEAPAASVIPQLLLAIANSVAFAPDRRLASAVVVPAAAPPLLVTVNASGVLVLPVTVAGKVAALGLITSAAGDTPTPVRPDDAVPPGEAVTDNVALFCPATVGAKATNIVHRAAGASAVPVQLSVVTVISVESEIVADSVPLATPPVLVTVNVTAELLWPTNTDPKL
jgi:hypothetical protein